MALAMVFAAAVIAKQEDIVKGMLPDSDLKATVVKLNDADVKKIQGILGDDKPVKDSYEIYVSKTGVVVIEKQMGKWGMIDMAIQIDPATKKLVDIQIILMSMKEKRGLPIKAQPFRKQFKGKGIDDPCSVEKDIVRVTGATISSKAVCVAAKRALAVYDIFLARAGAGEKKK